MAAYPPGTKVAIKDGTRFSEQIWETGGLGAPGTVYIPEGETYFPDEDWMDVEWPNGYRNTYMMEDLILLDIANATNKQVKTLLDREW